jgi:hypothetical protein
MLDFIPNINSKRIGMASFGYDELFNNAHFAETFNHSRTGLKNKFVPKKKGFTTKSGFSEQIIEPIRTVSRFVPTPKQPFRSNIERFLTRFDQFRFIENNDASMSKFAVCRCPMRRHAKKPVPCRTRYNNWKGLNSS